MPDLDPVLGHIRAQAASQNFRIILHAHQEMVEEGFTLYHVVEAIASG